MLIPSFALSKRTRPISNLLRKARLVRSYSRERVLLRVCPSREVRVDVDELKMRAPGRVDALEIVPSAAVIEDRESPSAFGHEHT